MLGLQTTTGQSPLISNNPTHHSVDGFRSESTEALLKPSITEGKNHLKPASTDEYNKDEPVRLSERRVTPSGKKKQPESAPYGGVEEGYTSAVFGLGGAYLNSLSPQTESQGRPSNDVSTSTLPEEPPAPALSFPEINKNIVLEQFPNNHRFGSSPLAPLEELTRGLGEKETEKVTLLYIMNRHKALYSEYCNPTGYPHASIDNDYTRNVDGLMALAREEGYLPKESESFYLLPKDHAIFNRIIMYKSPEGDCFISDPHIAGSALVPVQKYEDMKDIFLPQYFYIVERRPDHSGWYDEAAPDIYYVSDTPLDLRIPDAELKEMLYPRYGVDPTHESEHGDLFDAILGKSVIPDRSAKDVSEVEYAFAPHSADKAPKIVPDSEQRTTQEAPKTQSDLEQASTREAPKEEAPEVESDPQPPAVSDSDYDYGDMLARYGDSDFYGDKLEATFAEPGEFYSGVGAAMFEGTAATGFALYKRHKIKHRQHNITLAHHVINTKPGVPKHQRHLSMDFERFKDYSHLTSIVDFGDLSEKDMPLANLLKSHKSYQTPDDVKQLVVDLTTLFPDDAELSALAGLIDKPFLANPRQIALLQRPLKKYGITIEYQKIGPLKKQVADKFRSKKNEKLRACLHKTVLDKEKLFSALQQANKVPPSKLITELGETKRPAVNILYQLKNYDDWKLSYINRDTAIKVGAAATGILPIIPAYDSLRLTAYHKEGKYRRHNEDYIARRISMSLNALHDHVEHFTDNDYHKVWLSLHHLMETKLRHNGLKKGRADRMKIIHGTSAVVMPFSDIAGPIGSGVRSAAKGAAKIANSLYPAIKRYRGDQQQRQEKTFSTTIEIYQLYKELYQKAQATGNQGLEHAMKQLAKNSFDLNPDEFETLTATSLVENGRLKLSFARPTGDLSRVSSDVDETSSLAPLLS